MTEEDLRTLTTQCRRLRMACGADVAQPPVFWTALGREILATSQRGERLLVRAGDDTVTDVKLVLEQLANLRAIASARATQAKWYADSRRPMNVPL